MLDHRQMSRSYRQMKRRRNKQIILSLFLLALLFVLILFVLIFKGNDATDFESEKKDENHLTTESNQNEPTGEPIDSDSKQLEDDQKDSSLDDNIVIQFVESDDDNVIEAFVGNWKPIGTVQEEPHTTNYDDGSQDRIEIKKAVLQVTNISEEDLVELWIGNGGEQKVIANVKNRSNDEIYRVYLSWIEHNGWQVTLVERLKQFKR